MTLYKHLAKLAKQMNDLNQKFLDVSVKSANNEGGSSEELVAIRKQISGLGVYAKLYNDFQSLIKEMLSCRELIADSADDKEMRKMAEDDLAAL